MTIGNAVIFSEVTGLPIRVKSWPVGQSIVFSKDKGWIDQKGLPVKDPDSYSDYLKSQDWKVVTHNAFSYSQEGVLLPFDRSSVVGVTYVSGVVDGLL